MDREEDRAEREGGPANLGAVPNHEDNTVPRSSAEAASSAEKVGRLVLDIARAIGRQMACDDYECRTAVSDKRDLGGGGDDYVYGDDLTRTSRRFYDTHATAFRRLTAASGRRRPSTEI